MSHFYASRSGIEVPKNINLRQSFKAVARAAHKTTVGLAGAVRSGLTTDRPVKTALTVGVAYGLMAALIEVSSVGTTLFCAALLLKAHKYGGEILSKRQEEQSKQNVSFARALAIVDKDLQAMEARERASFSSNAVRRTPTQ